MGPQGERKMMTFEQTPFCTAQGLLEFSKALNDLYKNLEAGQYDVTVTLKDGSKVSKQVSIEPEGDTLLEIFQATEEPKVVKHAVVSERCPLLYKIRFLSAVKILFGRTTTSPFINLSMPCPHPVYPMFLAGKFHSEALSQGEPV